MLSSVLLCSANKRDIAPSYSGRNSATMRSVLITGTSTGIGQATAVTLAARGWRVFATMRNLEKRGLLEQALKEAGVQNGVEIEQLDVNEPPRSEQPSDPRYRKPATSLTRSFTMPGWRPPAPWRMCRSPSCGG